MSRFAFFLAAASTAACASSPPARVPARVPAKTVVLAGPIEAPPPEAPEIPVPEDAGFGAEACQIAGPKANLTVEVGAGDEPFSVALRGARVVVVPRGEDVSSVAVQGALTFLGRAPELAFHPRAPVVVAGGLLELGRTSFLKKTSHLGDVLIAKTVDVGTPAVLGEVSVPCSALTFVGSGDPSEDKHPETPGSGLHRPACSDPCPTYETPDVIDMYAGPGKGAHLRLSGSTFVSELARSGRWALVFTEDEVHMDARLTGWVEHARLTKLDGGIGFSGNRYVPEPMNRGTSGATVKGPGTYQGPAHIAVGARFFTQSEGGEPWATVRDGAAAFEVLIWPGEHDRVQVMRAPFMPSLQNAWVSSKAVKALRPTPSP
jgi:hypothetical protein